MAKPYAKTETISHIIVHIMYEDGKKELKTFSDKSLKQFKKSKAWKRVLSATKLQEQHVSIKSKIYPEGVSIKTNQSFAFQ